MSSPMPAQPTRGPPPFPLGVRMAFASGLLLFALGLAEGAIRVLDGNAFPQLDIFFVDHEQLRVEPNVSVRVRRADGHVYTLHTGAEGLRFPESGAGLLVGDSQALGLGVADEDTFAALAGLRNAGVPGHGVPDAVGHARELIPLLHPTRVVVVLNQANDWVDGTRPAVERYMVAGGWLGAPERAGTATAAFWGSPLSQVHLFAIAAMVIEAHPQEGAPPPAADEARQLTTTFGALLRLLRADFPEVEVVPLFLPADAATSRARAAVSPLGFPGEPWLDHTLRDGVRNELADFPLVDLSDSLGDPANFLEHDYHLSEAGHRVVGAGLLAGEATE